MIRRMMVLVLVTAVGCGSSQGTTGDEDAVADSSDLSGGLWPTVSDVTSTSVVISFTSRSAGYGGVDYGTTPSLGSQSAPDYDITTTHSFTLSGLAPQTTYDYRAWNVLGNHASNSAALTFSTAATAISESDAGAAPDAGGSGGKDAGGADGGGSDSGGGGSASCGAKSAPIAGRTYHLAPASLGGSDANDGLSAGKPWLTPKHAISCGDTILATPSASYVSSSFNSGNWGQVSCPSGDNVAWLKCSTFDGCKVTSASSPGMYVDQSYWGVQGWEATASGSTGEACFNAAPTYANPKSIHHVVFANDIANGCKMGGLGSFNIGTASVDYLAIVGSIAYNAAQGTDHCYSGISIYQPVQSDSLPGTHLYVGGNFAYGNIGPNDCNNGEDDGGGGLIFDTFDGSQGGFAAAYVAQAVAEDNIFVGNGAAGFSIQNNVAGATHAPVYVRNNTIWGNNVDATSTDALCDELLINSAYATSMTGNIVQSNVTSACSNHTVGAFFSYQGNATDTVSGNFFDAVSGQHTGSYDSAGFVVGTNTLGVSPGFASSKVPAAPSCAGSASVPACMASLVADFAPKAAGTAGLGYRTPITACTDDSLFPSWLCNVGLPSGLVGNHCE